MESTFTSLPASLVFISLTLYPSLMSIFILYPLTIHFPFCSTVMYLFTCWVVLSWAKLKPQSLQSKCRVAANPISGNSQAPTSLPSSPPVLFTIPAYPFSSEREGNKRKMSDSEGDEGRNI